MSLESARVLDEAADLIDKVGWTQKAMTKDGKVCLHRAISIALGSPGGNLNYYQTQEEIYYAIKRIIGYYNTILWNDLPGRTQEEVTSMLRKAAAEERHLCLQ